MATTKTKPAPVEVVQVETPKQIGGFAIVEAPMHDGGLDLLERTHWNFTDLPVSTPQKKLALVVPESDASRARSAATQQAKKHGLKIRTRQILNAAGEKTGEIEIYRVA